MKIYNKIVLDVDGTLIDTKAIHFEALNEALKRYGVDPITDIAHKTIYCGLPTSVKLTKLGLNGDLAKKILAEKQALTEEAIFHGKFDDLKPFMQLLRDRGWKIGVASNAVRRSVDMMLRSCCGDFEFDLVLSNEDVDSPKPDPEIYIKAAEHFNCYPQDILVIEDNFNHGIRSAVDAGCAVLRTSSVEETKDILSYLLTDDIDVE